MTPAEEIHAEHAQHIAAARQTLTGAALDAHTARMDRWRDLMLAKVAGGGERAPIEEDVTC